MAEDPLKGELWLKLMAMLTKLGRDFAADLADEGRKWSAALRQLALLLRKEAQERKTLASTERADDRQRISMIEKRLKALDDRLEWWIEVFEEGAEESGSRG